jgi:hypothetical protein
MNFQKVGYGLICTLSMLSASTFGELGSLVEEVESKTQKKKEFLSDVFKQRMRTQLLARDALLLSLNFEHEKYQKELLEKSELFDKEIKKLLEKKEDVLSLSKSVPDYSKRVLRLEKTWKEFYQNIKILTKNVNDEKALKYITENNILLLTDIDFILRKYMEFNRSSDSLAKALQHKQIMLFSQIGMPRAYIQKIIKEKLLIKKEIKVIENRQNLNITIHALSRLLKAFREGDETLELEGTSDVKFLQKLTTVELLWNELLPFYTKEILTKEESLSMLKKSEEFIKAHTSLVILSNQTNDQ